MPSEARQKKIMEKLNRAQKCSILGPQNLGSREGARASGAPPGSAPGIHTEWWQWQRYRSSCEHLHLFVLNPFMTTPLPLPLECEHPHLIALNPFIGNDIVAVVITQCERTLKHRRVSAFCNINIPLVLFCQHQKVIDSELTTLQWRIQDFPRGGGANSQSGCANLFFRPKTA